MGSGREGNTDIEEQARNFHGTENVLFLKKRGMHAAFLGTSHVLMDILYCTIKRKEVAMG